MNLCLKLWKGLWSLVIDVTVKTDSLLVNVLKFFGLLAGRCGSGSGERKRLDKKRPDSFSRFEPGLQFSFFLIETLSIAKTRSFINKHGGSRLVQAKVIYTPTLFYAAKGL